jgi:hypothetical protein
MHLICKIPVTLAVTRCLQAVAGFQHAVGEAFATAVGPQLQEGAAQATQEVGQPPTLAVGKAMLAHLRYWSTLLHRPKRLPWVPENHGNSLNPSAACHVNCNSASQCQLGAFAMVSLLAQVMGIVRGWGQGWSRGRGNQGGLHWATYKATCRRDGEW